MRAALFDADADGGEQADMLYTLLTLRNEIRTALRRIRHPEIPGGALVVDVGCGGLPYPGAHVACDFYADDLERADPLKIDRPFVWAAADRLPFRTGAFGFSVASHLLEHIDRPAAVLTELQRVSSAGYIETPSAFYEFAVPHPYHVSRCSVIRDKLVVVMKDRWDQRLDDRYSDLQEELPRTWRRLATVDNDAVLTTFRWSGKIDFEVRGARPPEKPIGAMKEASRQLDRSLLRRVVIRLVYLAMTPRPPVDLETVLACPQCLGPLEYPPSQAGAQCPCCNRAFPKVAGLFDFRLSDAGRGGIGDARGGPSSGVERPRDH